MKKQNGGDTKCRRLGLCFSKNLLISSQEFKLKKIKIIFRDKLPCWYDLVWRGELGIVLRIHSEFIRREGHLLKNAPVVGQFVKDFNFKSFGNVFGQNFGFDDCLPFLGRRDDFIEYSVPTPLVRKPSGRKCEMCEGGIGSRAQIGDHCSFCNGSGKEIVYDYTEAWQVSATLTVLFQFLNYPDFDTSCIFPQLLGVQTSTRREANGGSLSGHYSPDAVNWMRSHGPGPVLGVVSAMKVVWERMEGVMQSFYKNDFRAYVTNEQGWFVADCPGNACGIHPEDHCITRGSGYKFTCHNTDSPMQQLTLLGGLAALSSLIRES